MCLDITGGKMQDLSWQMIGQLGMGIKIQKVFMIVEAFCLCRISFRKVPVQYSVIIKVIPCISFR